MGAGGRSPGFSGAKLIVTYDPSDPFSGLLAQAIPFGWKLAKGHVRNVEDAQELNAATCAKLSFAFNKNPERFATEEAWQGWMVTTMKHLAIDWHRAQRARIREEAMDPEVLESVETPAEPEPEPWEQEDEHRAWVRARTIALDSCRKAERECWIRNKLDGVSFAQIARERGIDKDTVKKYVHAVNTVMKEAKRAQRREEA